MIRIEQIFSMHYLYEESRKILIPEILLSPNLIISLFDSDLSMIKTFDLWREFD